MAFSTYREIYFNNLNKNNSKTLRLCFLTPLKRLQLGKISFANFFVSVKIFVDNADMQILNFAIHYPSENEKSSPSNFTPI